MDFFIENTNEFLDAAIYIATAVIFIYCVMFINKVKKNGTDTQKQAVKDAAVDTLNIILLLFVFVIVLVLMIYVFGGLGVIEPVRPSASGFPLRLLGVIAVIFYGTFRYRSQ